MHAILESLQDFIQGLDTLGQSLMVFLISMVPVIELRGALPIAAYAGMPWFLALPVAVAGNLVPIPFILLFIKKIFAFLRAHTPLGGLVDRLERRAQSKSGKIQKYEMFGLCVFVAIPLPGTGGWTGALIAAIIGLRLRLAFPTIALGVLIAGIIMTILSYGVAAVVGTVG